MFTVTIFTDNAAFEGNEGPEIARILRTIADRAEAEMPGWSNPMKLLDYNGNKVGVAEYKP